MTKAKRDDLKLELIQKLNENEKVIKIFNEKIKQGYFIFELEETEIIINEMLSSIIKLTDEHEELMLYNFGSFKAVTREQINSKIKEKRVPKFKAGKAFNDAILRSE